MSGTPPTTNPALPAPPRRGSSIAARLFWAVGLPASLIVVALGALAWRTTTTAVQESLTRELRATVQAAASSVSVRSASTLIEGSEDTAAYRRTVARLRQIASFTGSSRVLLVDEGERVLADHEGKLAIGTPAPRVALDRVELASARTGTPAVSAPFALDDGRRFLAAYARLPLPQDELAAPDGERAFPIIVLVLEAPAVALDAADATARKVAVLVALAVLLVAASSLVVARTITRPLLRLAAEAGRLGKGELADPLSVPAGDDEVARLGATLERMRKALVDRDAERQMMLAGIAHEVRNPLGGMELFSGLLEEGLVELPAEAVSGPVKDELVNQAQRVRKELRYLTGVVNDFLAFARDTPLQKEPVDVAALLDDVATLCRREGTARLLVQVEGVGAVELDRNRIKQALLNLVENALSATPVDGTVTLRAEHGDGRLALVIDDTGKGMDAATLERVWTPFFTTKEKGSGLGLPLVRKLARDHGGDARIRSAPGEGTTVTLEVPT
ncbi:MAG: HAMP domain-containing histidine kinase [Deltaproteobacteria bacterium]|nr:HAMP domain-containing histidine kinase [Deltaproteobacteria bacterium]